MAGIDIGFERAGQLSRAAVAVLRLPDLTAVERRVVRQPTGFPYIPGLLSFREIPAAVATTPDLLLCDGHGFAHPRRFGLACHLGWLLDVPSIGVAKSRLIHTFDAPSPARGASARSGRSDRCRSALARRRLTGVRIARPSLVGQSSALRLALACTGRYWLPEPEPEPTRHAHSVASAR